MGAKEWVEESERSSQEKGLEPTTTETSQEDYWGWQEKVMFERRDQRKAGKDIEIPRENEFPEALHLCQRVRQSNVCLD